MSTASTMILRVGLAAAFCTPACQMPSDARPFDAGVQRSSIDMSFLSTETTNDFGGKTEEDSLTVGVSHGIFVSPNIEVGGELAYFSDDYSDNFGGSAEASGAAVGGYGRYYFIADSAQRPFAELGLGFGRMEYGGPDADMAIVSLGVGSMQMLSDNTALEFVLRYSMTSIDIEGFDLEQDTLSLFAGYSVFL